MKTKESGDAMITFIPVLIMGVLIVGLIWRVMTIHEDGQQMETFKHKCKSKGHVYVKIGEFRMMCLNKAAVVDIQND